MDHDGSFDEDGRWFQSPTFFSTELAEIGRQPKWITTRG